MKNSEWVLIIQLSLFLNHSPLVFGRPNKMVESESESGSEEIQMDRSIGFRLPKPSNSTTIKPYPFLPINHAEWHSKPSEHMKQVAKNDTDPMDEDYYATYDFEFAKSAVKTPNFSKKLKKYQEATKTKNPPSSPLNQIPDSEKPAPITVTEKPTAIIITEKPATITITEKPKKEEEQKPVKNEDEKPDKKEEEKPNNKEESPEKKVEDTPVKKVEDTPVKKEEEKSDKKEEKPDQPEKKVEETLMKQEEKSDKKEEEKSDKKKEEKSDKKQKPELESVGDIISGIV